MMKHNSLNLPVAKLDNKNGYTILTNPEILTWAGRTGEGFVWVDECNAMTVLEPDFFKPKKLWGEIRVRAYKDEDGNLSIMFTDPPQKNDWRMLT